MNVLSISQSNVLGDDVLLMIFEHLKGEDLVKCEAVCRPWRDILLTETPWRRIFHRKVNSSHLWRYEQRNLEKNPPTLPTEQYRNVCKNLLQVERNWCTGRFEKSVYSVDESDASDITISDDYVAWHSLCVWDSKNGHHGHRCLFLDKESKEITEFPLVFKYRNFNEMKVKRFANSTRPEVEVRESKHQWTMNVGNKEENGYFHRHMAFASGRLFEYSRLYNNSGTERIQIWRKGNPIHGHTFSDRQLEIDKVDEHFIVSIVSDYPHPANAHTFFIFSTETLDEFTSLSVKGCEWKYDRGLLFLYRGNGIVRVMDVASGTYFNDVRLPSRPCSLFWDKWASSNSNVIIIGWNYRKNSGVLSHLSVYDLEAMKKANSDPGCHLLYTLQFQFYINSFVMNESDIAFCGMAQNYAPLPKIIPHPKQSMIVLNFANFNFDERKSSDSKKNPEDNENIYMAIIYDPFFDPGNFCD